MGVIWSLGYVLIMVANIQFLTRNPVDSASSRQQDLELRCLLLSLFVQADSSSFVQNMTEHKGSKNERKSDGYKTCVKTTTKAIWTEAATKKDRVK